MIVAWRYARDGQRAGDDGQRRRRPWSVSLATLVSCCGEGGQVAGVLHKPRRGLIAAAKVEPHNIVVQQLEAIHMDVPMAFQPIAASSSKACLLRRHMTSWIARIVVLSRTPTTAGFARVLVAKITRSAWRRPINDRSFIGQARQDTALRPHRQGTP